MMEFSCLDQSHWLGEKDVGLDWNLPVFPLVKKKKRIRESFGHYCKNKSCAGITLNKNEVAEAVRRGN